MSISLDFPLSSLTAAALQNARQQTPGISNGTPVLHWLSWKYRSILKQYKLSKLGLTNQGNSGV